MPGKEGNPKQLFYIGFILTFSISRDRMAVSPKEMIKE